MDEVYVGIVERTAPVVVEATIDASPDAVWELSSDIELPARFSDEFVGADWIEPSRAGGTLRGTERPE